MDLFNLIEKYIEDISQTKTLNDDEVYSKLLFALQLPSICGRIDYKKEDNITLYANDGKPKDKAIFIKWITEHCKTFSRYVDSKDNCFIANSLYDLRCKLTHEGIIISSKNEDFKIYFIKEDVIPIIANGYMFISPIVICEIIFDAALKTLVNEKYKICEFKNICIDKNLYNEIFETLSKRWRDYWDAQPENKKIYDKYGKQDEKIRNEIEIYEEENKKIIEECINNKTGSLNDSARI